MKKRNYNILLERGIKSTKEEQNARKIDRIKAYCNAIAEWGKHGSLERITPTSKSN